MNTPSVTISPDRATLEKHVRCATHEEDLEIEDWQIQPFTTGIGKASGGTSCIRGTGRARDRRIPWSLVVKVVRAPTTGVGVVSDTALMHPYFWKREVLAYKSGILDQLPGRIVAPRCFGVDEQPDGSCWIWLEYIEDIQPLPWPLAHYRTAAYNLGTWNGAYLAGTPLPDYPWLCRRFYQQWISAWETMIHISDMVMGDRIWTHPAVRALVTPAWVDQLRRLWRDHMALWNALEHLPACLCHFDAVDVNLLTSRDTHANEQMVLIDWAFVGLGPLGSDPARLYAGARTFYHIEIDQIQPLYELIYEGYIDGLRAAGWQGDVRLVRCTYVTTLTLMTWAMAYRFSQLIDEQTAERIARSYGRSVEECLAFYASGLERLPEMVHEMRTLHEVLSI